MTSNKFHSKLIPLCHSKMAALHALLYLATQKYCVMSFFHSPPPFNGSLNDQLPTRGIKIAEQISPLLNFIVLSY